MGSEEILKSGNLASINRNESFSHSKFDGSFFIIKIPSG